MAVHEHRASAAGVACAIVTTSDTRTTDTDESGRLAREALERAGHSVVSHAIVPNDAAKIREELSRLEGAGARFVLTTGGTGIGPKDVTLDAVEPLLARRLPGFGELFRSLSYDEIGAATILSRADLGVTAGGMIVACVPGSRGAVKLAVEQILAKELAHLVRELTK